MTNLNESDDKILSSTCVLLAEDNPINQKVAVGILSRKGVKVTVANNGQEAIDILAKEGRDHFDLVLMDLDMPVMDGYEATRTIRGNQTLSDLPVIAVTAHTNDEDKELSHAAGVTDHIGKPIKPELLFGAILNAVKTQRDL